MHEEIETAPVFGDSFKNSIDRGGIGDIAMADNIGAQFGCQGAHPLFQRLALIGEGQLRASRMRCLGNAPGNRAGVGQTHDQAALAS